MRKTHELPLLTLGALGIVYGDIGTSPLYALRECFNPLHGVEATPTNVLGVLSLIIWSLILVVTIKYILFVMRADNDGEGGTLALTALAQRYKSVRTTHGLGMVVILGLFGAAFLYGDGIITPAISILSAVEGLEVATPLSKPYVVMIAVVVLLGLFLVQSRGTEWIGSICGPIMLLWFCTIGLLGLLGILRAPEVLGAVDPVQGVRFLSDHTSQGFVVLGSVFLALTGAEALYADMGHFGKQPIQVGWFSVALPGLLLQYFGQGALLLQDPQAVSNPFYLLAPTWMLYPLVGLATAATVIASQAMIAGVFSLSLQAAQLGYLPPLLIQHTSSAHIGQIYLPTVNWLMMLGTGGLVLAFGSSSNLAAAYGIAVAATMVITTLLMYAVARRIWKWNRWLAGSIVSVFLLIDVTFFAANMPKIPHGGWFPLVLSILIFTLMTTWNTGRAIVATHMKAQFPNVDHFLREITSMAVTRVHGTAVFMTPNPDVTPPALIQNVKHNHVLHQRIVFVTVLTERVPHVPCEKQVEAKLIDRDIYRVMIRYGFMDAPDVPSALFECTQQGLEFLPAETTFFLSRLTFLATPKPGMAIWREKFFAFLSRNSQRSSSFFRIPSNRVIEIGLVLEI